MTLSIFKKCIFCNFLIPEGCSTPHYCQNFPLKSFFQKYSGDEIFEINFRKNKMQLCIGKNFFIIFHSPNNFVNDLVGASRIYKGKEIKVPQTEKELDKILETFWKLKVMI